MSKNYNQDSKKHNKSILFCIIFLIIGIRYTVKIPTGHCDFNTALLQSYLYFYGTPLTVYDSNNTY